MYARAYILYIFGGLNFMSTTGNAVPLFFLTLLIFGSFLITARGQCLHIYTGNYVKHVKRR
jgi:hypothetical protein